MFIAENIVPTLLGDVKGGVEDCGVLVVEVIFFHQHLVYELEDAIGAIIHLSRNFIQGFLQRSTANFLIWNELRKLTLKVPSDYVMI